MESRTTYVNEDPLGFTKQTATMLVGLGAGDLIPQFRRKNISTQALTTLYKDDLIVLGADENLADEMLKQLRSATRKYGGKDLSEELKTSQLIKILIGANQQLSLMEMFVAYARLRLTENPKDVIINTRTNVRASQALYSATACLMAEIQELEKNYKQLTSELTDNTRRTKRLKLLAISTGIGLTAGLLCTLRYAIVTGGRS